MTSDTTPQPARITAADARPVRRRILRPGQPDDRLVYPDDDAPTTMHLGVRTESGGLVSVASFYHQPLPGSASPAVRLRGMATLPDHRSQGHGRRLVESALAELTLAGGQPTIWCNARTTAAGYYKRLGFEQIGGIFDIPDIGPHAVMVLNARNGRPTS